MRPEVVRVRQRPPAIPDVQAVERGSEPSLPRGIEPHRPQIVASDPGVRRREGIEERAALRIEDIDAVLQLHASGIDQPRGSLSQGEDVVGGRQVPDSRCRVVPVDPRPRDGVRAAVPDPEPLARIRENSEGVRFLEGAPGRAAGERARSQYPRAEPELPIDARALVLEIELVSDVPFVQDQCGRAARFHRKLGDAQVLRGHAVGRITDHQRDVGPLGRPL